jgi:hypothetical protein
VENCLHSPIDLNGVCVVKHWNIFCTSSFLFQPVSADRELSKLALV